MKEIPSMITVVKAVDNCCIISWISKSEAIKLLQNTDFTETL